MSKEEVFIMVENVSKEELYELKWQIFALIFHLTHMCRVTLEEYENGISVTNRQNGIYIPNLVASIRELWLKYNAIAGENSTLPEIKVLIREIAEWSTEEYFEYSDAEYRIVYGDKACDMMIERRKLFLERENEENGCLKKADGIDLARKFENDERISKEESRILLEYYSCNKEDIVRERLDVIKNSHKKNKKFFNKIYALLAVIEIYTLVPFSFLSYTVYQSGLAFETVLMHCPNITYFLLAGMTLPVLGFIGCETYKVVFPIIDNLVAKRSLDRDIKTLQEACNLAVDFEKVPEEKTDSICEVVNEDPKEERNVVNTNVDEFLEEVLTFLRELDTMIDHDYLDEIVDIVEKYSDAQEAVKSSCCSTTDMFAAYTMMDSCFVRFYEIKNRIGLQMNANLVSAVNSGVIKNIRDELEKLRTDVLTLEEDKRFTIMPTRNE